MNLSQAIILGITEGITEYLPISSTGHLVLVSNLLLIAQTEFVKSFEIFIQMGAIVAVVVLYWKDFLDTKQWPKIIAGFLPTAILGLVFYKFIKNYLLGNVAITLAALLLGGVVLMVIGKLKQKSEPITIKRALEIGLFQAVSMIPGISRSAATIVGAMLLGVSKEEAVKHSFLLAVPTMAAATVLDLAKSNFSFSNNEWLLLVVGFVTSFITAILAIKLFIKYVQSHSFTSFGFYRIALAIIYYFV